MSLLNYLDIANSNRINDLSVFNPFAVFGFVLLVLMIPIMVVLLTIVLRRSVRVRLQTGQEYGHRGVAGLTIKAKQSPVPLIIEPDAGAMTLAEV